MQKESNRYKWIDFDQKVRTYGQDAGIVFQERNGDKDWEWYSEEEAARLTYDGKEKLKFDPRGDGSLTINGNVKVDGTKIEINHGTTVPTKNADTEAPGLRLDSPNDGGLIYGYDTNNSIFLRVGLDGDAAVIDSHAYGRLRFFTGGQLNEQKERLRIDEAGNVGIGTTDPKARLHVAGDVKVDGTKIEINHGTTVPTKNADTEAPGLRLDSPNDGGLIYGYDTNNSIFLRVGLDGDAAVIDSHASGRLRFFTGGQLNEQKERLRIDEAGNVGIGTMDPKSKLDVAGDIFVAGILNTGWLTVREPLTAMKGVNIDGGLNVNSGAIRLVGHILDFGNNVVMCTWGEASGLWFGVFYNGVCKAYCDLNNGVWKTGYDKSLKDITG